MRKVFMVLLALMMAVMMTASLYSVYIVYKNQSAIAQNPAQAQPVTQQQAPAATAAPATAPAATTVPAPAETQPAPDAAAETTAPAEDTGTPAAQPDPATMSTADIAAFFTEAVNKTKAYTAPVNVHHVKSFTASITEITGGSVVKGIADGVIGQIVEPVDENLTFNNGTAVDSEGNTIPLLLPETGNAVLTADSLASASASADATGTNIELSIIPENADQNTVPPIHSGLIGYLDVTELDLSTIKIESINITYTGSSIKAHVNSDGYIDRAEYTMPLHVDANGKIAIVSGKAVFDGQEIVTWEMTY